MLFPPSRHVHPCPDFYSHLPRGKQALTRTRRTGSVSWTGAPRRPAGSCSRVPGKTGGGSRCRRCSALDEPLGVAGTLTRGRARPGGAVRAPPAPPGLTPQSPSSSGGSRRGLTASSYLEAVSPVEGSLPLREWGPTCYAAEGHRGVTARGRGGVGGILKPWGPGRLRSGPEVPTVTPPAREWGWGRDWRSVPAGLRTAGPLPKGNMSPVSLAPPPSVHSPHSDIRQSSSPYAAPLKKGAHRRPRLPPRPNLDQEPRRRPAPSESRSPAAGPPPAPTPRSGSAGGGEPAR